MGDEQRLGYEDLLSAVREGLDEGTDFTVAVEEEFALLDPATLGLVNRFEEVQAASKGTALEPHLVGELIASEVEVKTGRRETFADIPATMTERRAQLQAVVDPLGIALCATGTPPSSAARTSGSSTRLATVATTNCSATWSGGTNTSGSTSTSASAAPTARSRSRTACATCCPRSWRCRRARRSTRTSTPACTRLGRRSSRVSSRAAACLTPSPRGRSTRTMSATSTRRAPSPSTPSSGGASGRRASRSRRSRSASPMASQTWGRLRRWRRS